MTLRHFQIFVEVVHCKKMKAAAQRLFVSQPTVSQAVTELEKHYRVRLFERYPQGLVITPAGEHLYRQAVPLLESYSQLESAMKDSAPARVLRLGGTLTVGHAILRPLLRQFSQAYPPADFRIVVDNTQAMEELLLSNRLDAAVVEGIIHHPYLKVFPTIPDCLVLVCGRGHPFAARARIAPEELSGQPFLLREVGSGTRLLFENFMRERKYPLNVQWECSNPDTIKNAVMDGFGLSVISIRLVEEELRRGDLKLVDVEGCRWERQFSLVYHKNKFLTPQLRDLIDFIMSYEDNGALALLRS
ncbi:MAG: LysR family transcriptional regulator [Lawsonibacter sp.]|nr:LysR family transcriptional regulator [Lawsonibacter sp.]